MKKIVVLEDTPERIKWLRNAFPDAEIEWHNSVNPFLASVNSTTSSIALIILDHDLGMIATDSDSANDGVLITITSDTSGDKEGLTGYNAAQQLENVNSIPVIVWSVNPQGGKSIHDVLQTFGFDVGLIPFYKNNYWKLITVIKNCLET